VRVQAPENPSRNVISLAWPGSSSHGANRGLCTFLEQAETKKRIGACSATAYESNGIGLDQPALLHRRGNEGSK